jgi:PAS domain S-box-containing protein
MLAFWQIETARALQEGFPALRVAAEMSWVLQGRPGSERLLEYESGLDTFLNGAGCLITCLYDWQRLNPEMLFSLLTTHPSIAVGTDSNDNFYYLPPGDLTTDVTPMTILSLWLESLAERKRAVEALEENRQRLQALFENALHAILLIYDEMRLVDANPAACALLGASFEELVQLTIIYITPGSFYERTKQTWQTLIAKGKLNDEYTLVRQDGTTFVIEYHAVANISPGLHLAMLHDITERKRAQLEIRQHAARMEALAEISQTLVKVGLDVQVVLETIVRYTAEAIGDVSRLSLRTSKEQLFQPVAFHHPDPEVKALMESIYPFTPISPSPAWFDDILQTGEGVLIPEVDQEQFKQNVQLEYLPFFEQVGVYSILNVPLWVEGRIIGVLGLTRDQPGHPYTTDDKVFLQALADRAALTIENAQLFSHVKDQREQLQTLSGRLLEVQEAERRHIARELHDEIGQVLTDLKMLLDMNALLPVKEVTSHLSQARQLVDELIDQVDELSLDLRPPMLDDLGLLPALLSHFEGYTKQNQIQVTFQQTGLDGRRFGQEIDTAVFRLIQEALTNVARHAGVDNVTVRLWVGLDVLGVEVEDQGAGFDPEAKRASMGLSGMRERVLLLGGRLNIESAPETGTTITAVLPLPDRVERSDSDDDNRSG